MDTEIITLAEILDFFKDDTNTVRKGELKFKSDFVLDLRIDELTVNAKVRATMKDKSYSVSLTIDGSGGIKQAICECPRGKWICSHMAAASIYVNKKGFSKTDLPNSWIARPKKAAKQEVRTISDLFPHPRPDYKAASRKVDEADKQFLFNQLSRSAACPLQWIIGPEPPSTLLDGESLCEPVQIFQLLGLFKEDQNKCFEKCSVSREQIAWLAENTKDQYKSSLWGKHRYLRLTGSSFGLVLAAYERHVLNGKPYPPSLFKTLKGEYSLAGKDSIMWGQMHEEKALQEYIKLTGNTVKSVGLILLPCGFLGCSPDGIINLKDVATNDVGVLEIKCPWKHRDHTVAEIIKEEVENKRSTSFYLKLDATLNESHSYWHQVQGEMIAADATWAHFVVWTTREIKVIYVSRSTSWAETNIPKLKDFYANEFLPQCIN
ncbi:uncharacterized protein LOC135693705 [Rhopilema esculentum]|uniref:uncharacterized protein LOC135693705 n=1 Tax=Rhopilema esculentum TaxID=499914 RepID=UPI0031E0F4ED|eukprot:gene11095-19958_t